MIKIKVTQINFDLTSEDDIDTDIDDAAMIENQFHEELCSDFIGKIYEIPSEDDIDDVADTISNESGFCIKSWDYELV